MMIFVEKTCPFCGTNSLVGVELADLRNWEDGELAQDAFPYLTASQREILISGMCSTCQEKIFG